MKDLFETVIKLLNDDSNKAFDYSLAHCHAPGLFSLVINGAPGNLTRIFIAQEEIAPYQIQLHDHKYGITLIPICGQIKHYEAVFNSASGHTMSKYSFTSAIDKSFSLKYVNEVGILIKDYLIPPGSTLYLNHNQVHTVSCDRGSMWIVKESGEKKEETTLLGVPFEMNPIFYRKATDFEINYARGHAIAALEDLMAKYEGDA